LSHWPKKKKKEGGKGEREASTVHSRNSSQRGTPKKGRKKTPGLFPHTERGGKGEKAAGGGIITGETHRYFRSCNPMERGVRKKKERRGGKVVVEDNIQSCEEKEESALSEEGKRRRRQ